MRYLFITLFAVLSLSWGEPAGCRILFGTDAGKDCRCVRFTGKVMASGSYSTNYVEVCGDMEYYRHDMYVTRDEGTKLLSSRTCEYLPYTDKLDCVSMTSNLGSGMPTYYTKHRDEVKATLLKNFSRTDYEYLFDAPR